MLYHVRLKPGMRRLKVIRTCVVLHNLCDEESLELLEPQITESTKELRPRVLDDSSSDSSANSENEFEADFEEDGFQIRDQLCDEFENKPLRSKNTFI